MDIVLPKVREKGEYEMRSKKLLSVVLAASMVLSLGTPVLAADSNNLFPHRYTSEGGSFELSKVSHPDKPANYRHAGPKIADGIVDYLGNGKVGVPGVDVGAKGQGARGQTYCWGSIAYGDYMYVNTLYDAAGNTEQLFGQAGADDSYSSEIMDKISQCLYRGDIFLGEEDGKTAGCVLVKINMKTGDIEIVMNNEMTVDSYGNNYGGYYAHAKGMNPQFRNAVEFNDKLYFIGAPSGIPSIWEIDPNNDDAFRRVYADPQIVKNPGLIVKMIQEEKMCVSIRGITAFDGHLIVSCVSADVNPYIAISKTDDPADGFVKIATTWVEDGTNSKEGELLGYPACHLTDSIYGGSIWEMIPFNNKLYVAMCTGTQENRPTPDTMQSFAIMEGSYTGDITDRNNWTWKPVIGDINDGAKYTFGIDPERTRSGACTMMVMGDHLYIGEYNDTEIAMVDMMSKGNPQFMADNLEQGVNLYRLDKNNNAELVVGNKTKMFPKGSLSGLKSGFGKKKTDHGNQYVWKLQAFQDKLYIGTFDESVVLHPLGQFTNGDLLKMKREDWEEQIRYIKELIEALKKEEGSEQVTMLDELIEAENDMNEMLDETEVNALSLPQTFSADERFESPVELYESMLILPYMLDQNEEWSLEEKLTAQANFINLYENMYESYSEMKIKFPSAIQKIIDKLLNNETFQTLHQVGRMLRYLATSKEGFDLYVWDGKKIDTITRDGMGDPYNSGLRAFAVNDSKENPWLSLGTANIFYGTQVWRLEGEGLNLPPVEEPEKKPETDDKKPETDNSKPETDNSKPETDNKKPGTDNSKPGTDNKKPDADHMQGENVKGTEIPKTGDHANMGMWLSIILLAGGLSTGIFVYKKKNKTV